MTTFNEKYNVDHAFAAEFLTLGTNTTNIADAFDTVANDTNYQDCVKQEFNREYREVFADVLTACANNGDITIKRIL